MILAQTPDPNMELLAESGLEKGFEVEEDRDYGAGPIDIVWKIPVHSGLPDIKCGFVKLDASEGGDPDTADNQFSLRKIEEGIMRGLRSGMDKLYLLTENEEMAKSVSGKIEWLASHGSLLRMDAVSLGLFPKQEGSSVITPSQRRVPKGEKLRKEAMRKREAKLDKYNKPIGKKDLSRDVLRESSIDKNSRPKDQIPKRRRKSL
jgi:hypothetical protein